MAVVLSICILYDYLKHLLSKLQLCLIYSFDYNDYRRIKKIIIKYDIFKGLKNDLILSDILYHLDNNDPVATLELIENNQNFLTGTPEYMLIMDHSKLLAYFMLDDLINIESTYSKLKSYKLKIRNFDKSRYKKLYNWDVIDGIYYVSQNQYTKAINLLENTNDKSMNLREKKQLYFILRHAYKGKGLNRKSEKITNKIMLLNQATVK